MKIKNDLPAQIKINSCRRLSMWTLDNQIKKVIHLMEASDNIAEFEWLYNKSKNRSN